MCVCLCHFVYVRVCAYVIVCACGKESVCASVMCVCVHVKECDVCLHMPLWGSGGGGSVCVGICVCARIHAYVCLYICVL